MKFQPLTTVFLAMILLLALTQGNAQSCYLTEGNNINLYEVNISSGALISTTTISVSSGNISEVYGMARNPVNDQVYVLYDAGSGIRGFGTINLDTGFITVINGNINNYRYQTMTFDSNGNCYALTASFGDSPWLLRQINPGTGVCFQLSDLED
ncbi:MAG: hypothetical protein AAF193_09485, partial [Bacteroidota bacterium]